jgi:hypothetical protein
MIFSRRRDVRTARLSNTNQMFNHRWTQIQRNGTSIRACGCPFAVEILVISALRIPLNCVSYLCSSVFICG